MYNQNQTSLDNFESIFLTSVRMSPWLSPAFKLFLSAELIVLDNF